jgi:predicted nucleotidyltransferase
MNFENIIKQYFKDRKEIAAVYLFGSYASGKNNYMSDVDIGILFTHQYSKSDKNFKEEYIIQLGRLLRKDIHPVLMNTADITTNTESKKAVEAMKQINCLNLSLSEINDYRSTGRH